MPPTKTLQARERELQSLVATPEGRAQLQEIASSYAAADGRVRPKGTSVITYILVYEREHGLIGS